MTIEVAKTEQETQPKPPEGTKPPEAQPGNTQPAKPGGTQQRVHNLTDAQVGEIKRKAEARAADKLAREMGYKDAATMKQAIARRNAAKPATKPNGKPATTQPSSGKVNTPTANGSDANRDASRVTKLSRDNSLTQSKLRRLKRDHDLALADAEMEKEALRQGVVDEGFVVHLMREDVKRMAPEEVQKFDEKAWYAKLRADRPHLFKAATPEAVKPVTNGPPNAAPPAADPSQVTKATGQTPPTFDARKATQEQLNQRARERGLNLNPTVPGG